MSAYHSLKLHRVLPLDGSGVFNDPFFMPVSYCFRSRFSATLPRFDAFGLFFLCSRFISLRAAFGDFIVRSNLPLLP